MPAYDASFPAGTAVRVVDAARLGDFKATWKFHHPLRDSQMSMAGEVFKVERVLYYHGGDPLYELRNVAGVLWQEVCLEKA